MSELRPCIVESTIDSNDRKDRDQDTVRSKLKSTDFRKLEVKMSDMTAHSSATSYTSDSHNVNDTKISLKNSQTEKELPADDEDLLPSQTVVVDEINTIMDEDTPKAFNLYRNKKLLSHGMMDVALFSANANQLRYVLESSDGSFFYVICVMLLLISIFLQILVGITLLLSARYNVTNYDQRKMAFKLGNYIIIGIFLITVVNIFITSFGGPTITPPTILANPITDVPESIQLNI